MQIYLRIQMQYTVDGACSLNNRSSWLFVSYIPHVLLCVMCHRPTQMENAMHSHNLGRTKWKMWKKHFSPALKKQYLNCDDIYTGFAFNKHPTYESTLTFRDHVQIATFFYSQFPFCLLISSAFQKEFLTRPNAGISFAIALNRAVLGKKKLMIKSTPAKKWMWVKEMEMAGKMHENASSIFAHNKHKLSTMARYNFRLTHTLTYTHILYLALSPRRFVCEFESAVQFRFTRPCDQCVSYFYTCYAIYLFSHRGIRYPRSPFPSAPRSRSLSRRFYFSFRSDSHSSSWVLCVYVCVYIARTLIRVCSSAWLSALFDAVSFSPALMIFTVDEFFFFLIFAIRTLTRIHTW